MIPARHHPFLDAAGIALAYGALGLLSLASGPGPQGLALVQPAAGLALVACLVHGRVGLAGTVCGALLAGLVVGLSRPAGTSAGWPDLAWPLLLAAPAVLQAALGAGLVRRRVASSPALAEPGEILRFMLFGGALPCLGGAVLAALLAASVGGQAPAAAVMTGLQAWLGGSLGVAIGGPVVLCLFGQPAARWRPRRLSVALPLAGMALLLVVAAGAVTHWEQRQRSSVFERDAAIAADSVAVGLQHPLLVLRAVHGVFAADARPSGAQVREAASEWLGQDDGLHVIGFSQWVPRAELPAFEAEVRRTEDRPQYRVFDRSGPGAVATAGDAEVVAIRFNESRATGPAPLGLNALSVAAARQAIGRARATGLPSATSGFRLTAGDPNQVSVVIYRPVQERDGGRFRGVVFAAMSMQSRLDRLLAQAPLRLAACLVDVSEAAQPTRLAGAPGCEVAPAGAFRLERELPYANRLWQLRLDAPPRPASLWTDASTYTVASLLAAALVGMLLLMMSGHTDRVERLVAHRTRALRHEIAERQHAEQAWRDSEQRLRTIFDSAPVGIVYADLQGRILRANPAYARLMRSTEDELRRHAEADFVHPDDRALVAARLQALLTAPRPAAGHGAADGFRTDKRCLRADGSLLYAQVTVALLRDEHGRPQATVTVVEDIAERLARAEAERARDAAQAADQAKSGFIARMSHELRTPLNAMLGYAQLLGMDRQPALAARQLDWVGHIERAGWHLLRMIEDTLELSRLESGVVSLEARRLDLQPLVHDALAMVRGQAAQLGLRLETDFGHPADGAVAADATRVMQILTNLLSNAIKYNVPGGSVRVSTRAGSAGTVEVEVADTGLGMSPAQLAQLFQPYNRLGREATPIEGTGIGLVISRRLAAAMGGALEATSAAGRGSRFMLTLPWAAAGAAEPPAAAPARTAAAAVRRQVLYVEDNLDNVGVMRGVLQQRPQVTLAVAGTGRDALAAMREAPPHAVVLDMNLPDMDGLALLARLHAEADLAGIPVLVLSADASQDRIDAARQAGARYYLTKPLNIGAFLAALDAVLDGSGAPDGLPGSAPRPAAAGRATAP